MFIIKRDGRKVAFDNQKIQDAILKAFYAVDDIISPYALQKAENIANYIEDLTKKLDSDFTVEEIQDLVEHGLMSCKRKDVARAYITYRNERNLERKKQSELRKLYKEKLAAKDVQNQNANVDEKSFGGRIGEANSIIMKDIALYDIVSEKTRYNHINNRSYMHDLDHYAVGDHNCLTLPIDDLLKNGFKTRQVDIRPAGSINTAFQLLAVLFQLQSLQQFGGVAAGHLDWSMVPYVRKSFWKHFKDGMFYIEQQPWEQVPGNGDRSIEDDIYKNWTRAYDYAMEMTTRETYQAVEGMYHNLNSLQSRSGNQLPFTSLNYGTCTYPEARLVTRALLEKLLEGTGDKHKTSIFPCGIFQYMKYVNNKPGTPNYDLYRLALKATARRIYPNYANCDWSGNAGYDINDPRTYFATMGCRTANGWDINGLGQQKDGRGNICPATIILPTLAEEASIAILDDPNTRGTSEEIVEKFMEILDEVIHDTKDSLIERFEYICSQAPESAKFMYENNTMAGYIPEEGIRSALKHGTLAVGQLGLAECLQILIGCDHTEPKGMELAKRIEQLFKDRCAEFKNEYKLNFGVYMTPAENLCYTAMKKFKETYGIIPNVSDHEYFTNSMHVPVWKKMSAYDKIDIESQLTGYSSAGCITYVELDSGCKNNIDALEQLVNYAMEKDIPYFALNTCLDTCLDCGYTDELNDTCPECGSHNIQRLRRVTG